MYFGVWNIEDQFKKSSEFLGSEVVTQAQIKTIQPLQFVPTFSITWKCWVIIWSCFFFFSFSLKNKFLFAVVSVIDLYFMRWEHQMKGFYVNFYIYGQLSFLPDLEVELECLTLKSRRGNTISCWLWVSSFLELKVWCQCGGLSRNHHYHKKKKRKTTVRHFCYKRILTPLKPRWEDSEASSSSLTTGRSLTSAFLSTRASLTWFTTRSRLKRSISAVSDQIADDRNQVFINWVQFELALLCAAVIFQALYAL